MRMRVVEVSGKTVDEAVERALEQLGLRREQVDVDVIREGSRGFFGLGGEDAIVRVSALEPAGGMRAGGSASLPRNAQREPQGSDGRQEAAPSREDGGRAPGARGP